MSLPQFCEIHAYAASQAPQAFYYASEMHGLSDATVLCDDGAELPAHRAILALASPVICESCLLSGPFKLPAPATVVMALFRCIYDKTCLNASTARVAASKGVLHPMVRLAHFLAAECFAALASLACERAPLEELGDLFELAEFCRNPTFMEHAYQIMFRFRENCKEFEAFMRACSGTPRLRDAALFTCLLQEDCRRRRAFAGMWPGMTIRRYLETMSREYESSWLVEANLDKRHISPRFVQSGVDFDVDIAFSRREEGAVHAKINLYTDDAVRGYAYRLRILGVPAGSHEVAGYAVLDGWGKTVEIDLGIDTDTLFQKFVYSPIVRDLPSIVQHSLLFQVSVHDFIW